METKGKVPDVDRYTVEEAAPGLRVVRDPEGLFKELEKKAQIPFLLQHSHKSLRAPPKGVKSIFAKKSKEAQSRNKPKVNLTWETVITLTCPETVILNYLKEQLLGAGVAFELDTAQSTVTFPKSQESLIKKAIQTMKKDYQIQIKEADIK